MKDPAEKIELLTFVAMELEKDQKMIGIVDIVEVPAEIVDEEEKGEIDQIQETKTVAVVRVVEEIAPQAEIDIKNEGLV